jgi:hypothetical protein
LTFANELDENDLDAIVSDFVSLVKTFKIKLPAALKKLAKNAKNQIENQMEEVAGEQSQCISFFVDSSKISL